MRAPLLLLLALSACPPPPLEGPSALVWPAKLETSSDVTVFAVFDAGTALGRTELSYALGDEYPKDVVLVPKEGVACDFATGKLTWSSIVSVDGTAATPSIVDGSLKLTLAEEGVVTIFLAGSIDQQRCPGGQTVVPLTHRLVVTVHRVASFEVTQLSKSWPGCDQLVLPSGAELYPPTVHPMNAAGLRFLATNAPSPAEVKLNSQAALTLKGSKFTAAPSHVTVSVATTLPVDGIESFEVVGPQTATSMQASLWLRLAVSNGWNSEELVDDRSYSLRFPDEFNSVDVLANTVTTSAGKLCELAPASWFEVESSTPGVCAKASEPPRFTGAVPVAQLLAEGECRLLLKVTGTSHSWSARFSTTRP